MVYISSQAYSDIDKIFVGLLHWKKHELSIEFAEKYIDDIIEQCYTISNLTFHTDCKALSHRHFGTKEYRYRRNKHTTWYIVYDIDSMNKVYINRILSNHVSI